MSKPDGMEVEKTVEEGTPTEDEYFEQELLDFLQIITSIQSNLSNKPSANCTEPLDEIECIITRFKKINCVMPSDQWTRVYVGLKQLSQIITSHSEAFESWTLLRDLFESAKKFRTKYPTAQSGHKQKQKSMHQVLKFAKEFADDQDITHEIKKMTKSVKQSKIKQIKKKANAIKSLPESSISHTKQVPAIASKSSKSPVITKKTEKTKKPVPAKDEASKKTQLSSKVQLDHDRDKETDRDRPRDRERDRSHRHRHRHRSRSRSRSRDRHRRSRHHHSYRSRSTSRNRDRPSPTSRSARNTNNRSHPRHELDEWGLPPAIHNTEYIGDMCLYQEKQREMMNKTDIVVDDLDKIPVVYGDSEICHGFNEGRCRLDPCKYHHVCWSCKGRGHPSSVCPYKATRPYDAPPSHHKPCINWNMSGCPGGCLCTDRHICLFCRGHHPMRHSAVCSWKFNREIQMNKRKAFDPNKSIKERQNLNPIGQYEHLRLKDEENGTFQDKQAQPQHALRISNKRMSMTPPPSMTIPTSFMAKSIEKDETVSITEICVLYNTPSGCPAKYGKNDDHLHRVDAAATTANEIAANPNTYDGVCQLKHRCRECFGRHSFFDCPFRYHGIKCFIVNDIVRYKEFPKRVYIVNGFIDRRDASSHSKYHRYSKSNNYNVKRKQLQSPKLKITEVGLDLTAAQIEIAASTLSKIVSSVKMQYKYPKMMIKELPTTISSQQVENKLRLLFHEKGIQNIVKIQCTASQSNWIISFLSVTDRENACNQLQGCSMQARELKIAPFDDHDNKQNSNGNTTTNEAAATANETAEDVEDKKSLQLITKDEVPVHEHLYYCTLCDIGLFEYGLLRQHLSSSAHISLLHRKGSSERFAVTANEEINLNECILCGTNVIQCTMSEHMSSNNHDNSNILMMLSLVRCAVSSVYHCRVCNINITNSREYFIHCNSEQHRGGLEEAIEPCPYFNKRGSGCQNDRCQFKHVCVGCNALTPIYRCKRCKNNEVCNMFNKGGAGCWYARGSCHRRHICHYCHGTHPKVGCPKLFPNCKKIFNNQGQEIKPGQEIKSNRNKPGVPPPPQQPPPPQANYPYNQAPPTQPGPPAHYGRYPPPPNMPLPQYGRYPPQQPPPNMTGPPSYPPPHAANYPPPYGPPPPRHQYPPQTR